MKTWLVDTGPLVAYLDRADPAHEEVAACLAGFRGRLVTTGAVITETMHFVADDPAGPRLLAEFIAANAVEVHDMAQPPELREIVSLMEKYGDVPMDFADGTLVLLAEALGVHDVLTLDRRGFRIYRTRRGRSMRLVLDPA